ncbi:MAG: 50S ribosomal protein L23 [Candidatus Gracilibacteria bacterium]|nr:50S ribosomal protein L23 [Candidatus Gracilibacteria bacterium]
MNSLYSVIKRFVVTNKSTDGEVRGVYTCMIDPAATKIDVKNAFKTIYGVDVEKVNVLHTREKFHNTKLGVTRKKGIEKKAMVTLKNGQKVANFEVIQ